MPKILYTLRTSPAYRNPDILKRWDEVLKNTFTQITNVPLTEDSWTQATLPVDLGGLGLRRAEDLALPAYLSSAAASSALVRTILTPFDVAEPADPAAVGEWCTRTGPEVNVPIGEDSHRQREWDRPMAEFSREVLLSNADQRSRARLLAAAAPRSGVWLNVIPASTLGTGPRYSEDRPEPPHRSSSLRAAQMPLRSASR